MKYDCLVVRSIDKRMRRLYFVDDEFIDAADVRRIIPRAVLKRFESTPMGSTIYTNNNDTINKRESGDKQEEGRNQKVQTFGGKSREITRWSDRKGVVLKPSNGMEGVNAYSGAGDPQHLLFGGHYPYANQESSYYYGQQNYGGQPELGGHYHENGISPTTIAVGAASTLFSLYLFLAYHWDILPKVPFERVREWVKTNPKKMFLDLINKGSLKIQNKNMRAYFERVDMELANTIPKEDSNLCVFVVAFRLIELQKVNSTKTGTAVFVAINTAISYQAALLASLSDDNVKSADTDNKTKEYCIAVPPLFINKFKSNVKFTFETLSIPKSGNAKQDEVELPADQSVTISEELSRALEQVRVAEALSAAKTKEAEDVQNNMVAVKKRATDAETQKDEEIKRLGERVKEAEASVDSEKDRADTLKSENEHMRARLQEATRHRDTTEQRLIELKSQFDEFQKLLSQKTDELDQTKAVFVNHQVNLPLHVLAGFKQLLEDCTHYHATKQSIAGASNIIEALWNYIYPYTQDILSYNEQVETLKRQVVTLEALIHTVTGESDACLIREARGNHAVTVAQEENKTITESLRVAGDKIAELSDSVLPLLKEIESVKDFTSADSLASKVAQSYTLSVTAKQTVTEVLYIIVKKNILVKNVLRETMTFEENEEGEEDGEEDVQGEGDGSSEEKGEDEGKGEESTEDNEELDNLQEKVSSIDKISKNFTALVDKCNVATSFNDTYDTLLRDCAAILNFTEVPRDKQELKSQFKNLLQDFVTHNQENVLRYLSYFLKIRAESSTRAYNAMVQVFKFKTKPNFDKLRDLIKIYTKRNAEVRQLKYLKRNPSVFFRVREQQKETAKQKRIDENRKSRDAIVGVPVQGGGFSHKCAGVVESVHEAFVYLFPVALLQQVMADARNRGVVRRSSRKSGGTVIHFLASLLDVNIIVAARRDGSAKIEHESTTTEVTKTGAYKSVKCYLSENSTAEEVGSNSVSGETINNKCSVETGGSAPYIVIETFRQPSSHEQNEREDSSTIRVSPLLEAQSSASTTADLSASSNSVATREDAENGNNDAEEDNDGRCFRLLFFEGSPFLTLKKVKVWLTSTASQCGSQCPRKFAPGVMSDYRNWLVSQVDVKKTKHK
jgi:hypothetical protein